MSFVLADQQGWLSSSSPQPFTFHPLQTFASLRAGVNSGDVDFFMWEHFTSKKYYDNGEIKRVGEIYTPWSSWKIVATTSNERYTKDEIDSALGALFKSLDEGVAYFEKNEKESVEYISTALDYSEADAREWLKTVKFTMGTKGVDAKVIEKTVETLKKAGVLGESGMEFTEMILSAR
jgi:ABC-type nitrate/sulfonate/bicarbonate transport system substrate-binding protein